MLATYTEKLETFFLLKLFARTWKYFHRRKAKMQCDILPTFIISHMEKRK